jgi:DNA-binding MarR family transcriptional regulator
MTRLDSAPDDEQWADLADLVLIIARELAAHTTTNGNAIVLVGSERNVMRTIDRNPGLSAGEIARLSGLQRSNLSSAVRSLEKKGLVERRHDDADARGVLLYPTELSASNLAILRREWAEMLSTAAGPSLREDESVGTMVRLLTAIEDGLVSKRL